MGLLHKPTKHKKRPPSMFTGGDRLNQAKQRPALRAPQRVVEHGHAVEQHPAGDKRSCAHRGSGITGLHGLHDEIWRGN